MFYGLSDKVADRIRGRQRPVARTLEGWNQWEEKMKKTRPIRYWLSDTLLERVLTMIFWPVEKLRNLRHYFRNRFVDRVHVLPTRLPKGYWMDFDTRLLHAMMEGLVDYVETELGHEFRPRRSAKRGLKHLSWEISLKRGETYHLDALDPEFDNPTDQAVSAQEVYELYTWWKIERTERPDPFDFIGEDGEGKYDEMTRIENEQYAEDTEMLIRLVKIRQSMWT